MPTSQEVDLEATFVEVENGEVTTLEKAHELLVAGTPYLGTTKQTNDDNRQEPDEAILPPMDLDKLAALSQTNATRRSIIDAIARNTVGLGYAVQLSEAKETEVRDDSGENEKVRAALEAAAARDKRLDSPSFTDLMMAVKTDEEEVGGGYLEVSRNKTTGKIDGLFHAPGKRVRRKKDRTGFLLLGPQGTTDDAIQFYNFGEKIEYDEDGAPTSKLAGGKAWDRNEILPFRIYSSESRDYGLPRDAALMLEYLGDKLAAQSNISFFDSSGTPPTVLFVQGEEARDGSRVTFKVPQATIDRIAGVLKSDGGHRHRVAIIPLPAGAKVHSEKLGQISERDMGFVAYRKDNTLRQLGAFRLSPIFVANVDDGGRYTAEVQRALSLEQVFDPEQQRYETRLHNTILKDLGYPNHTIKFKRLAVENDAAKRDSADKMAEVGVITRREHRKAHGLGPIPEAAKSETEIEWNGRPYKSAEPEPGQVPFGWNDEIVNSEPPKGAENRTVEGDDQRGLRPNIGARRRRQQTQNGVDVSAESQAAGLRVAAEAAGKGATSRARERAGV